MDPGNRASMPAPTNNTCRSRFPGPHSTRVPPLPAPEATGFKRRQTWDPKGSQLDAPCSRHAGIPSEIASGDSARSPRVAERVQGRIRRFPGVLTRWAQVCRWHSGSRFPACVLNAEIPAPLECGDDSKRTGRGTQGRARKPTYLCRKLSKMRRYINSCP